MVAGVRVATSRPRPRTASASPFRRHLLQAAGLSFKVVTADVDEAAVTETEAHGKCKRHCVDDIGGTTPILPILPLPRWRGGSRRGTGRRQTGRREPHVGLSLARHGRHSPGHLLPLHMRNMPAAAADG